MPIAYEFDKNHRQVTKRQREGWRKRAREGVRERGGSKRASMCVREKK